MVKLLVSIAMELEGVTDVRPAEEEYEYFFTVICTGCREEHPKTVSFNRQEEHELSGSRGAANFVWRCPHCKPFVALDCRGLEFTAFHFRGKWKCIGAESGVGFELDWEEADEEGRWDEYDEKAEAPVSVSEVSSTITRA